MKKKYKKIYKENNFIERFSFIMIYIINKMLVLLKNHLNAFLKSLIDF